MTYWLVLWIGFSCPGGWFSGLVPEAARPVVCKLQPETELYSSETEARKRVLKLGPAAATRLKSCKGLKCSERPVTWTPRLEIGE